MAGERTKLVVTQREGLGSPESRRLRKAGKGPRFVQTSDRRIGVSVGENRRWREARALPA